MRVRKWHILEHLVHHTLEIKTLLRAHFFDVQPCQGSSYIRLDYSRLWSILLFIKQLHQFSIHYYLCVTILKPYEYFMASAAPVIFR